MNVPSRSSGRRAADGSSLLRLSLVSIVLVFLCVGCAGPPGSTGSGGATSEIVTHTVSPGETLRSIADDYYGTPDADEYLARVNSISIDETLPDGAFIDVPVSRSDLSRYRDRTAAKIFYNRGTILASSGDLRKAVEGFTKALEVDPTFMDARYNRAIVFLKLGDLATATSELETVVAVRPDDLGSVFALGKACYEGGRDEAALEQFAKVLAADPGHEDALFASAATLDRMDRDEEAFIRFMSYLAKFPDGQWSVLARERVEEMVLLFGDDR